MSEAAEFEVTPAGAVDLEEEDTAESDNTPQSRWALVRLVCVIAVLVGVFFYFGLANLLLVITVLIVMVMLHELGHFATAK